MADPGCPKDGVVLRLLACGICRSDWHGWVGPAQSHAKPTMPGPALAGTIVEIGRDVRLWKKGDRVTIVLNGETVIEQAQVPGLQPKGPIGLQHHGDPIQFANVFVREL